MLLRALVALCAWPVVLQASAVTRRGSVPFEEPIQKFELHVNQEHLDPDCSNTPILSMVVNHQMPGPTLEVRQGDRVRVTVFNDLPVAANGSTAHDMTIHFHGIRQYNSVHSDGVPYVTQLPIRPGESYVHDFRVVNQAGTYFYHAHIGMRAQSVYGAFIVHENAPLPFEYDEERTVQLSEWWHRTSADFEDYLMGPKFHLIPEAESILINGQTLINDEASRFEAIDAKCNGYAVIPVDENKKYRLRVIGATAFRTLYFAIAGHNMSVIEVDGQPVQPYEVAALEVTPGQRFSVILETKTNPEHQDYLIATQRAWSDSEVDRHSNGKAILRYTTPETQKTSKMAALKRIDSTMDDSTFHWPADRIGWLWDEMEPLHGVDPVVFNKPHRTLVFRATEKHMNDGTVRWFMNDKAFMEDGSDSILAQLAAGFDPNSGYDADLGTYPIAHYEVVDLVLVSTHMPKAPCRSHPWHTHASRDNLFFGHSHWEISRGPGDYNEAEHGHWRNAVRPLHRDISMVYPWVDPELEEKGANGSVPIACGWSKLRIVADNPGTWPVHCHNTAHMMMGMGFVLEEAQELIPRYNALAAPES
ncbi:Cupredoxin [Gongronella butleri]|nr:Cupredoxin [Gongronella butleri]